MGFNEDGVACIDQRLDAGRRDANPGFVVFHFLGNANDHGLKIPRKGMLANAGGSTVYAEESKLQVPRLRSG